MTHADADLGPVVVFQFVKERLDQSALAKFQERRRKLNRKPASKSVADGIVDEPMVGRFRKLREAGSAEDLLAFDQRDTAGHANPRIEQGYEVVEDHAPKFSHAEPFVKFWMLGLLGDFCTMNLVDQFNDYRSRMNDKILSADNLIIKRIFNLDTNAYQEGALDVKSKELIGLTCSLVLRCDDCVKYHLGKCREVGFTTAEVHEAMGVATLIGGTIVIPHLRRAFEFWEELSK